MSSREWTEEEVRSHFIRHVRHMVDYWAGLGNSNVDPDTSPRDRIMGFAHSMLAAIDGSSVAIPSFVLEWGSSGTGEGEFNQQIGIGGS